MKIIAGLGNPGSRYEATRHNAGFHVVDTLARELGLSWKNSQFQASVAQGNIENETILLVKPLTFMNDSGVAIGKIIRYYKIPLQQILIIFDDLDLPAGKVRVREKGSAAGHHGMESIIAHLSSQEFPRIKVGIGRPANGKVEIIDFVLGAPKGDDSIILQEGESIAAQAALLWARTDIAAAMNALSVPRKPDH